MTASPPSVARWRPGKLILAWLGLYVATFAAYWPALGGGFLWDDDAHVTKPALRSLPGLWRIWFEVGATQQYYPVLHSLFWFEHRLWGDAPLGYHLLNVFLHATAAALFALVLRRLLSRWDIPIFAAFLFALHPVGVESVAWISEQKNTLSTVFYLLAALVYLRGRGQVNDRNVAPRDVAIIDLTPSYFLATGFFVLALLSKSVTATLPAALLVVVWYRHGRLSWKRDVVPLLPWFALGGAAGLFTAWVERTYIGAQGSDFSLSLPERGLLAGRVICFYLGKQFWPADLSFIYPHWTVDTSVGGAWLYPLGVLAALAGLWILRRRTRAPLAAALLFVGTLFPALGFFNVYPFLFSYVADHFQYLAGLGVIAGVAGGLAALGRWLAPRGALVRPALAALLVAALGILTWRQARAYRDPETLYRTTLARNPDAWLADLNLGSMELARGKGDEAMAHYQEALRLNPDYPSTHFNLGKVFQQENRLPEAAAQFRQAIRIDPRDVESRDNLAIALAGMGRLPEAIAEFEEAIRLKPDYAPAEANLGVTLALANRLPEAIGHYQRALVLDPGRAEVHSDLGMALQAVGRDAEAADQFRTAARLRSNP